MSRSSPSDGYPCLLRRAWICLVLKRKEARVAAAASTLAAHAWMTDDDELYAITYPLQERLWKAIYAKDNAQAVPNGEQSAPQKR
jgi:hypothetical protein